MYLKKSAKIKEYGVFTVKRGRIMKFVEQFNLNQE